MVGEVSVRVIRLLFGDVGVVWCIVLVLLVILVEVVVVCW